MPSSFSWDQDQCCPTGEVKIAEGLQLQLPKCTQVPGHDHGRKTINYTLYHLETFTAPQRSNSHMGRSLPSLPFLPALSFTYKKSKTQQTWRPKIIYFFSAQKKTQSVKYISKQRHGAQQCPTEIRASTVRKMQVEKEKEEKKEEDVGM